MMRKVLRVVAGTVSVAMLNAGVLVAQPIVRRDSASIRIVEIARDGLAALPIWRLDGPTVRIQPDMGGSEYELNRAGSAWRLSDGRIVVANNQVEMRFFDSMGRYQTTAARRGRGPGEYQQLLRIFRLPGDSLLAWDVPTFRIDIRDANGKYVRATKIPRTRALAGLGGSSALYEEYRYPDRRRRGVYQDTTILRRLDSDGSEGKIIARLPGQWRETLALGSEIEWREVWLSGVPMLSGNTKGAVYVQGDEFTAYWFGDSARLAAITRVRLQRTPVTAADRSNEEQRFREQRARNPNVRVDPARRPPVYSNYLPQVTHVVVDSEGRAWLRRWVPYGALQAEWIVLAPLGAPIARITMPAALQPNDIGVDYLLGILPDDDGVQSVYQYRIVRDGPSHR